MAAIVWCAALVGCAGLRSKSYIAESVAECRQFSREGVCAMESGDWGQAERLLRRAVKASPTDSDARWRLAETLWTSNDRDESLRHMREVVDLEPENAEAAVRFGEMLLASDQPNKALSHAQQALAINPRLADAWALRGRCHKRLGDVDRALADLHHSLQHEPDTRDVLADIAWTYRERGRRRRELTTLHMLRDTYVPGEEPIELLAGEADAYLALGRPRPAIERLRLACGRSTASAPLLCRLAEAEAAAGDTRQALATAQRAVTADAAHQPAQELLARFSNATLR